MNTRSGREAPRSDSKQKPAKIEKSRKEYESKQDKVIAKEDRKAARREPDKSTEKAPEKVSKVRTLPVQDVEMVEEKPQVKQTDQSNLKLQKYKKSIEK